MDERTYALVRDLKDHIDREAELFTALGEEVQRLRDTFQEKSWGPSLALAENIERSSRAIEEADAARDEAFFAVREALDLPQETTMSAVLPMLSDLLRSEMEESWRALRVAVVRVKTAAGRMRYSAETLASTLNGILEEVFPYRKGRIYSRRGTPTGVSGAVLVDHRLYHILINYQPARFPALLRTGSLSGKMLGEYTILDPIGRGGMAEVYRGRHATLGRIAAVKILLNVLAEDPDFRKRFEREAQLIGRLKHPHIVNLFDFGLQDGMYYMAMEYLQGRDLAQVIAEGGALPFDQVRWIVRDIADALDYAHGEGLIHRDIKPSNIMLEPITSPGKRTQRAVLMDFGIARLATSTTRLTDTGIVGTLDYVSPEQIKEDPDLDRRADIYSLGVMVYQMLTGRLPLTAANPGALVMAHLFEPPTDPRTYRRAIPQEWAAAVLRALAKDPRSRFAAAGEMAKMFQ